MAALPDTPLSTLRVANTPQVWKRGLRVRVDGSLVGVDKESAGMLPQWKRGGEQPRLAAAVLLLTAHRHLHLACSQAHDLPKLVKAAAACMPACWSKHKQQADACWHMPSELPLFIVCSLQPAV
jgi:hypothetical protein